MITFGYADIEEHVVENNGYDPIVDRKRQRLHVLTDPAGDDYESHRPYSPGEIVTLPGSIGADFTLDVGVILKAGQPRTR